MLEVTSVKIINVVDDPSTALAGTASIVLNNALCIEGCHIIKTPEKLFVAMPNRKVGEGTYKDVVHPINAECRSIIESAVISAYTQHIANAAVANTEEAAAE